MSLDDRSKELVELLRSYGSCAVAFSGGVDSAVVAQAAQLALGDAAVAVTGASASLAAGELQSAIDLAKQIGIRHQVIHTQEFSNPAYVENASDRCYHCKTELYTRLDGLAEKLGVAVIVNGANADDLGDYRPGMKAADERGVRSPLAECGITKAEVRQLAISWGLRVWDKPATPCLSSRVAYGEAVTPERLAMIDSAERYLRSLDLTLLRVRYHQGDIARLEIPLAELARFTQPPIRDQVVAQLKALGFKYVTLDLEGFRSGSMNDVLPISTLKILG
jgi:pyridinium-3,5-biscarboxylic acid mononucleotide sulfurtransferase